MIHSVSISPGQAWAKILQGIQSEEITLLLLIWFSFLGMAIGFRDNDGGGNWRLCYRVLSDSMVWLEPKCLFGRRPEPPIIEFTAPRLHDRSYETGLANVSRFPDLTESAFPYLTNILPDEAGPIQSALSEHTDAKKTIVRTLILLMEGGKEDSLKRINEALWQYPDNEDLLYWQQEIARRQ